MPQATLDLMCEHLKFLGYEIFLTEEQERRYARHQDKVSFVLKQIDDVVKFFSRVEVRDARAKNNMEEYLEFINTLNTDALVTRFYKDENANLLFVSQHLGHYDKVMFARFLELWEFDLQYLLLRKMNAEFMRFFST